MISRTVTHVTSNQDNLGEFRVYSIDFERDFGLVIGNRVYGTTVCTENQESKQPVYDFRFFHKDFTKDGLDPGNGLGLSIALSIAKIHNGSIDAQSELNKGTTFIVSLPISR